MTWWNTSCIEKMDRKWLWSDERRWKKKLGASSSLYYSVSLCPTRLPFLNSFHFMNMCVCVCVCLIEWSWQLAFDLIFGNKAPTSNGLSDGRSMSLDLLATTYLHSRLTVVRHVSVSHWSRVSSHRDSAKGFMKWSQVCARVCAFCFCLRSYLWRCLVSLLCLFLKASHSVHLSVAESKHLWGMSDIIC